MTCTFGHKLRRAKCVIIHGEDEKQQEMRNVMLLLPRKKVKNKKGREKLTITHLYHILVAAVELQTNISTITERERGDSEF